jgi:Helix-hairpin-helix motif
MKPLAIAGILLCLSTNSTAQESGRTDIDVQQILDDIGASQDLDIPYEERYESLVQILSEPYDINTVTAEELRLLGFLSQYQISRFLKYRETLGPFLSIYELQAIQGFDKMTIARLTHFLIFEDPSSKINASLLQRIAANKNTYFVMRYDRTLQKKRGFDHDIPTEKRFLGSPDQVYARFRSSRPGDYSVGFTLEKDAGERFLWQPIKQLGFDYSSYHLQVLNKGRIKNLIVGDYQVQAGQGLVLGGLFGLGKGGAETVSAIRRSNLGGLPYTSSNENGYLRGMLITYELKQKLLLTAFYSHARRDASIQEDTIGGKLVTALRSSGLHRSADEVVAKRGLSETNAGVMLNYKYRKTDIGILWNTLHFGTPVQKGPTLYNQFGFSGILNNNVSVFLNHSLHTHAFFSEFAWTVNGGPALVAGILASVSDKLDLALAYRYYGRDFHTFFANALSEGSTIQNESGIYWGWKYRWRKHVAVTGYVDLFTFPWLRYRNYAPSYGYECLLRFSAEIEHGTNFYIQVREESKSRNLSEDASHVFETGRGLKRNFLLGARIKVNSDLTIKTRAQISTYLLNGKNTSGFALMEDLRWDLGKFSLTGRYALFDTDDYDNRQYVYENDTWLSFALPAYSGIGVRNYLMLEYSISRKLACWIRFAHTRYTDRENVGSGYDLIDGNQRNDIKFQVRLKF